MKSCYSLLILFLFACKNSDSPKQTEPVTTATDTAEKKMYLPIADFIQEDIRFIDSFAAGILMKTEYKQKKDSVYVTPQVVKEYAKEFLVQELDSAFFADHFKEESFADQATQSLNFIYTSQEPKTSLRKAIVFVASKQNTNKVSKIYFEKEKISGDTAIKQRLTWRIQHYLIIAESRETSGGFSENKIRRLIWDPADYAE